MKPWTSALEASEFAIKIKCGSPPGKNRTAKSRSAIDWVVRMLETVGVSLLVATQTGCFVKREYLREDVIRSAGAYTFPKPKEAVFKACTGALATLGFQIAYQDLEKGVIKTAPKTEHLEARGGFGGAQAYEWAKRYELSLESMGEGQTRVVAWPRAIVNGQDLTDREVWHVPSQTEEWRHVFQEISSQL